MNRYSNFKSGYNPFELSYYEELKKNEELQMKIMDLEDELKYTQDALKYTTKKYDAAIEKMRKLQI